MGCRASYEVAIDKVMRGLDQGSALTLRRDAYFSIVRARVINMTRRTNDVEIGSGYADSRKSFVSDSGAPGMSPAIEAISFTLPLK